jgi:hypothetical protein
MKLQHSSAAPGYMVRRCLAVKHGLTAPNGCTWRYTLSLRGAGKHSAMNHLACVEQDVPCSRQSPRRGPSPPAASAAAAIQLQLDTVVPRAWTMLHPEAIGAIDVHTSPHLPARHYVAPQTRRPRNPAKNVSQQRPQAGQSRSAANPACPASCARRGFLHLLESAHCRSRERRAPPPVVSASLHRHTVECRCLATCGRTAKECTPTCSSAAAARARCRKICCFFTVLTQQTPCDRYRWLGTITGL